ncbi:MAG: hypothetical protein V2I38_03890 [Alcanivoracaceae bacterium]|jgi:hypothetical protein|nr:hypothetical protein [Alcanivoracaceae bacterium]
MTLAADDINRELLALTESFADGAVGPAEFRRRRRELICDWTGEDVPQIDLDLPAEDDTQPALKPITDKDIAAAKQSAVAPSVEVTAPPRRSYWGWWVTGLLLLIAAGGAVSLLWFVLRRSV